MKNNEILLKYSFGNIRLADWEILSRYITEKDIVVELGTYVGLTTIFISQIAKQVVTVDNYKYAGQITSHCTWNKNFKYEHVRDYLRQYPNISPIKSESNEYFTRVEDGIIDVLFIDANHSYARVKKDFEAGYDKVKDGGYIIFHDYTDQYDAVRGVFDFVNKEIKTNENLVQCDTTTEENNWMAVFQKKEIK